MKPDSLIRTVEIKDPSGQVVGTRDVAFYAGLLSRAHDQGLKKITTELVQTPSDANGQTAIARAVVETSKGTFEGLGDASSENVESFLVPHLIRVAETRAKARALRDAVNVGVVALEELDSAGVAPEISDCGLSRMGGGSSSRAGPVGQPARVGKPTVIALATGPMSEAQRRYLFRLLVARGIKAEAAEENLKGRFKVAALSEVTKQDATRMIDQLLKEAGQKAGAS